VQVCVCAGTSVIDPCSVKKIVGFQARFCMPSATAAPVRDTCMPARVGFGRAIQL